MGDSQVPAANHDRRGGHASHDPELIVALLDRDLPEGERATGQTLVDTCLSCAELHADLVVLAQATVSAPIPARPRDFALTPAVVASLLHQTPREPLPAGTRLSPEMRDTKTRHAAHDRLLIANFVDRAVDEAERARAEELLAACRDCEQLYDDLVALSAATRAMAVPARPRDFTLTAADADRLRIRGWRRVLSAIGSSRDAFSRPLALGLTTLGIAGLMVATIPSAFMGAASSPESAAGPSVEDAIGGIVENPEMYLQASGAPAAGTGPEIMAGAPSQVPAASAAAEAAPAPSGDLSTNRQNEPDGLFVGGESSPLAGEPDGGDGSQANLASDAPFDGSTMIPVAGLLVLMGLGLFGLRWTGRRLGDG